MADEPGSEHLDQLEEEEGGPVKSFLEHLEDLRWVLIKSLVGVGVGVLVCLIAGNHVVEILKWPARRAKISYPGTNQVVTFQVGTNRFHPMTLSAADQAAWNLGTNRFVGVKIEPAWIGTNQVLAWHTINDPTIAEDAQRLFVEFINLSPANGFFVAFQVAMYGGVVLASPFIFYFVAAFV